MEIYPSYTRLSLSSNISLFYEGDIFDRDQSIDDYLMEIFYGVEDLNVIQNHLIHFQQRDISINIIACDSLTNEVLVYVDPIGTKSLYVNDENRLSPSIESIRNRNSKLDYQYLGLIRKFGYNQNDLTPYVNIKRLLPGFMYRGIQGKFYHDREIIIIPNYVNTEFMLPVYLENSITNRLTHIKDETVGVLLSGGLDSSTLTALILKYKDVNPNLKFRFFTTENADDLKYAQEVAEMLNIKLEIIPGDDVELTDDELFKANETPIDLGSTVPNLKLFKRISSMGIKTVITGDGPDEMFRGYKRNAEDFDYHMHDILNELVYYHFPRLEKAARYYGINLITPYVQYQLWNMVLTHEVKMYKQDLKDVAQGLIPDSVIQRTKEPLKNKDLRADKVAYQHDFLKRFISYAEKTGESTQTTKK